MREEYAEKGDAPVFAATGNFFKPFQEGISTWQSPIRRGWGFAFMNKR